MSGAHDLGSFDHVIVGAGSAGSVLANRLSADPAVRVCLIEAGPVDRHPLIHIPLGLIWLAKSPKLNWLLSSTPQQALGGRRVSVPRGKVLGGSSAINGMIYVRGHRADYDAWAAAGCTGWGWDDVLPHFRSMECNAATDLDPALHGHDGALSVTDLSAPNPMDEIFVQAAESLQMRRNRDFNGAEQEGVGIYQVTQRNGRRESSATAFLDPVRQRPNLHVLTGLQAQRIEFEGKRACGVLLTAKDGQPQRVRAAGSVILSAGAFGSPALLLRSGIGPGAALQAAGRTVLHDLPGVGANLQDHVDVMVIARTETRSAYGLSLAAMPALAAHGLRYIFRRRGMPASNMVEAGGFVRSGPEADRPDLQFHFIPGRKSHRGRMLEWGHGVSLHTCVLRPQSRGSVKLDHANPDGPPLIDLGLLENPADAELLLRGVRLARRILRAEPFARHGLSEILPGDGVQDEAGLRAFITANARTVYHPVGTCAMGTGAGVVTDPRLRVYGVEGLRVVDASIMPTIVSGNTNAPAMMIAEKAAAMLREDRRAAVC